MTFTKLGKNVAFISVAALIVAACSKEPEPTATVTEPTETADTMGGQPDAVAAPTLEEQELARWGGATQGGVATYAGADRIFFAYDSSELSADARATLAKQAEWLMHYTRVRVTVEGHCDERGTREYNLALGERRAAAVKNYLIALGVPASRMNTISYGKERPAVVGDYAQNRRGVVVVN